jgi:Xaa-Pro dipeptidase
MNDLDLYRDHLETLDRILGDALEQAGRKGLPTDALVLHAGRLATYHADDELIPFRSTPHFRRWVPLEGPEHVVLARPGQVPKVVRVRPRDFWYDTSPPPEAYWEDAVEMDEVESFDEVAGALGDALGNPARLAYLGPTPEAAETLGIPPERIEPEEVVAPLDWYRASKTPWEIARIREAAERAAGGHLAARDAFLEGRPEREIHWAYLRGSRHLETELPFPNIVALDAKAAILHYEHKRGFEAAPGKVLLCDAGGAFEGYTADLTRTWVRRDAPGMDEVFFELLHGMDAMQRKLVRGVRPGRPYLEIHVESHRLLAQLLAETGLVRSSPEEALERGVTRTFLPHGVGHHLGIQVHDVGGRQAGPEGGEVPPPEDYPALRNTRILEPGHVVTIEPGLYFIDMLLEPLQESDEGKLVDWERVDRLKEHGGIRIEDDVLCTEGEPEDLTRELVEGPRGPLS